MYCYFWFVHWGSCCPNKNRIHCWIHWSNLRMYTVHNTALSSVSYCSCRISLLKMSIQYIPYIDQGKWETSMLGMFIALDTFLLMKGQIHIKAIFWGSLQDEGCRNHVPQLQPFASITLIRNSVADRVWDLWRFGANRAFIAAFLTLQMLDGCIHS